MSAETTAGEQFELRPIMVISMLRGNLQRTVLLLSMALSLLASSVAPGICATLCDTGLCPTCRNHSTGEAKHFQSLDKPVMACCRHRSSGLTQFAVGASSHSCCQFQPSVPSTAGPQFVGLTVSPQVDLALPVPSEAVAATVVRTRMTLHFSDLPPPLHQPHLPDLGRAPPVA